MLSSKYPAISQINNRRKSRLKTQRGAALIFALAVTLVLTLLITATIVQVVAQLHSSKDERDYDRALELAEAGANAYLNYLEAGQSSSPLVPWTSANGAPVIPDIPSNSQVRSDILAGNICLGTGTNTVAGTSYSNTVGLLSYPSQASLTTKPPKNQQFGYFVTVRNAPGATVSIVSYGYSNGIVRRVQLSGTSLSIFDWSALWTLDNNPGELAWAVSGVLNMIGNFGGQGRMGLGITSNFYDGPAMSAGPNAVWVAGTPTSSGASAPNVPPGHKGNGVVSNPFARTIPQNVTFPTADEVANLRTGANTGVEWYRAHNNNQTGLRLLAKNNVSGAIRELPGAYSVVPAGQYTLTWPAPATYTANGLDNATESPYGLRIYPGDYFFERVVMGPSDILDIRSYNDYDRTNHTPYSVNPPIPAMIDEVAGSGYPVSPVVTNDPPNPNGNDTGMRSGPRETNMWIGHAASGANNDLGSNFTAGTNMEYSRFPSRMRFYVANTALVQITGTFGVGPPVLFNGDMLVYNTGNNNNGRVKVSNSAYFRGSMVAWRILGADGVTFEQTPAESSSNALLTYKITSWSELP